MTEMIRLTTYPGKRTVYRSSITGKFVSKSHYLDNPDTTYKSTVRTPKYEWVYPEELLYGFEQVQFYDPTEDEWLIRLKWVSRSTRSSKLYMTSPTGETVCGLMSTSSRKTKQ